MSADEHVDQFVAAVRAYIDAALDAVHLRIDALLPSRDGRDGQPGRDGEPGPRGFNGEDGTNGRDGVDGLGFDDLEVVYDGERQFTLRFVHGERVKEFSFRLPVMIYRGAFHAGTIYERGDTVTHGGSLWHCNDNTENRPDDGVDAWTRAVRRGRDGKNGNDGQKGDPGPTGRPGRDLTQMAADGSKW